MLPKIRKALAAFGVAAGLNLLTVLDGGLTADEIGAAVGIGVAAGLAVYGIRNAQA